MKTALTPPQKTEGFIRPLSGATVSPFTRANPTAPAPFIMYVGLSVRAIGRLPLRGIEKMDYDEAFRILADKNRMKIMQLLCGEQAYGLELAEKLKLSPNTISHHMSKLQKCGLVISSFEGNRVYYRANKAAVDEFIRMLSKKLRVK